MHTDIVDLREFYLSPLGQTARRLLRLRLREIWPQLRGERVLALGYGTPLLRPLLEEAGAILPMMPAVQGVSFWPREGPNLSALVDANNLPLPDASIDRVIIMHGLEGADDPHGMSREIWRVLKNSGRLLVIVPNRRGLWAHSDGTPFGTGQPYSSSQIKDTLRDHGFLVDRMWRSLYMPPSQSRLLLTLADFFEKYGARFFPGFGGLLLLEAGKQLYAPLLTKTKAASHRLILPLQMPVSSNPLPTGRVIPQ
ncbi:MAG: methyltransferase domain-containing protein [Alphaproteobacteria bacterium]